MSLNQNRIIQNVLLFLFTLFLPIQLGKHLWPTFSFLLGFRIDYLSPTIYVTDVFVLALFLFWVLGKKRLFFHKHLISFFLTSLFLFLTILFSDTFFHGLYQLGKFFEYAFLVYYLSVTIDNTKQIKIVLTCFSLGVIGESFLAILQYIHQSSLGGLLYFLGEREFTSQTPGIANASLHGELVLRPYGTFSHPNVLAGYLLLSMTFILFAFFNTKDKKVKMFFSIAILSGTSGLFLSLSRVSIFLWVVILLGFGLSFLSRFPQRKKLLLLVLATSSICFFALVFLTTPFASRFYEIHLTDEAVTQREVLLQVAWSFLISHPMFGVGFGNFLPTLAKNPLFFKETLLQPVHNIFFLIAAETGISGLFLFLWFIRGVYNRLVHVITHQTKEKWFYQSVFVCLSFVMILGQFDHYFLTLQQGQLLFAYILGLSFVTFKTRYL